MTDSNTETNTGADGTRAGAYTEMMQEAVSTKSEESQQLQEQKFANARGGAIDPPFSPVRLAKLIELNTTHAKCGFSKARNVAGFGLEIVPHPEVKEPDESQRETARDFWFGEDSTWQVGPMESEKATHADVLEMAWADYEFIGWLSIETLTATDGTLTGLAYVPAPSIRKRKDDPGFVHVKKGKLRYFGAFGDRYGDDRTFVDVQTGAHGESVSGEVANEIIWKRNHTPFFDHYGTPDILPAIPNIEGDMKAREFNIEYFDNSAVPQIAITVEGGQLTEKSRKDIYKLFHEKLKGKNHRTAILEVEEMVNSSPTEFVEGGAGNVSIEIEPLTVGLDEDASFLGYQGHNEHEILKAHEVPPIEAGSIESGAFSTDAQAQRKSYLETTIRPKQEAFAQLLYETVHDALGVTDYTVQFKQRGVDTRMMDAEVAKTRIQASQGTLRVNEVREELGKEPLDGPIGDMLLAEVGDGAASGMGGIEEAMRDLVENAVEEQVSEVRDNLETDSRVTQPLED